MLDSALRIQSDDLKGESEVGEVNGVCFHVRRAKGKYIYAV